MADQTTAPAQEASTHTPTAGGLGEEEIDNKKVFIGNVAYGTTQEQLEELLKSSGVGNFTKADLPLKFGSRPGGFAFVTYEADADAQVALEKLNGLKLNEREISTALAKSDETRKQARAEKLASLKEKRKAATLAKKEKEAAELGAIETPTATTTAEGGEEAAAKPKKKKASKKRPARRLPEEGEDAPVESSPQEGEAAPKPATKKKARKPRDSKAATSASEAAEEARIDDALTAEEPKPKKVREKKEKKPKTVLTGEDSKTLLFVANLPFTVDDSALSEIFTKENIKVTSARVVTGPSYNKKIAPRSKGFGFVEVEDENQQKSAVEKLNGHLIGERAITVKVASERAPAPAEEAETEAAPAS